MLLLFCREVRAVFLRKSPILLWKYFVNYCNFSHCHTTLEPPAGVTPVGYPLTIFNPWYRGAHSFHYSPDISHCIRREEKNVLQDNGRCFIFGVLSFILVTWLFDYVGVTAECPAILEFHPWKVWNTTDQVAKTTPFSNVLSIDESGLANRLWRRPHP